jgi:dTDP-4-amino-4,6-dideoxygalactose transaminase
MIPLADPVFGSAEIEAVTDVLESGMVADGPEVRAFERAFAEHCGVTHAVATSNGTTALHTALTALGIGAGDRVVTTPLSFVASANAIRLAGARPVFADIDPDTYTLDPDATRDVVRDTDADAILAVHLYGLPADMASLSDIAATEDVVLIEDAAQAHGATYNGESVGTVGDAAAFSFYPTKNMTTGEGGMVLTEDETVADRAASFVNHGRTGDDSYAHERVGHNFRMTSLAAAIGRVQLDRLPKWVRNRRANADTLTDGLRTVDGIITPREPDGRTHAYHQYTIRTSKRDRLRAALAERGVDTGIYYPTPIHELAAYQDFDSTAPVAETAAEHVLSLPVHPNLTDAELDRIVNATRRAAAELEV